MGADYLSTSSLPTSSRRASALASYPSGRTIPSEKTLVQDYGLSRGTVRKAVQVLRERGIVDTVPQRGTYVI
jgi:DNA-binding GntR family transcriptional regulator